MRKIIVIMIDLVIIMLIACLGYLIIHEVLTQRELVEVQAANMEIVEAEFVDETCTDAYINEDVNHELDKSNYAIDQVIGYVEIPAHDVKVPIIQGNPEDGQIDAMNKGVSFDPRSSLPSNDPRSTIVLAGHREMSFAALEHVQPGDGVILNIDNNIYLFEIKSTFEFDETEVEKVFYQVDEDTLVMYTCFPFIKYGPVTGRFGVTAKRVDKIECV